MINYFAAFAAAMIAAISQILLKKSANQMHGGLFAKILNGKVVFAYALLVICVFLNTFAFTRVDLKYYQVFDVTSIIWVSIFAVVFLKEKIKKRKLLSIVLVIIGSIVFIL